MKQIPLLVAAALLAGPVLASEPEADATADLPRYDEFVEVMRANGCSMAEPEAEEKLSDAHGFEKDQVKAFVEYMTTQGVGELVRKFYEPTQLDEIFLVLSDDLCNAG